MKYLANGRAVEVVTELKDGKGFIIESYSTDPDGNDILIGDYDIVDNVYDTAPIEKFDDHILQRQAKLHELREECNAVQRDIREQQSAREQQKARFAKFEQLTLLDDFISGKITHYVSNSYGNVKIMEFKDSKAEDHRKEFRLLSLFGRSDGQLTWKLNQYYDNSGCAIEVFPCTSLADAKLIAKRLIENLISDKGRNPDIDLVENAIEFGVTVPEEYVKRARAIVTSHIRNRIKQLQADMDAEKLKLLNTYGETV